ncbi:HEPN domain-containing protein [Candidatus Woesearchaeota archaeon]|nr:HEPN domain-containing protein [Candidatus Woesearchaeota archaeon]
MRKQSFLSKLKEEGKLELVDPSSEIKDSYLEKSANSLKASNILFESGLLEEAVSMAYYSMYHSLLALMFKCGIKCENHSGNILLLRDLFNEVKLYKMISDAKEERIDKQYYVDFEVTDNEVEDLTRMAQEFVTKLKLLIEQLTTEGVEVLRERLRKNEL